MKQYIIGLILIILQLNSFSQDVKRFVSFMDPYLLQITYNKTTNLVFPYSIKSVDMGSPDLLVQKAKYADTILQLKAGREEFKETSLSVVTTDGKLYSFLVQYATSPVRLNYLFNTQTNSTAHLLHQKHVDNELDFLLNAKNIASNKRFIHGVRKEDYKMYLQLDGIYISNEHIYLQLQLNNTSNLPYKIETLRFLIRDKKASKRTSTQEIELKPVYTYGNTNCINSKSSQRYVFVLPAFMIDNSKYLVFQLSEKMGGRTIGLKIKDRHILKAKSIDTSN
ncbi:conjugative transposon protein TraN [Segetibacter koreensis]|uniref:conjugative transposon protein TraN n=1 Tax=Segetibacter koreensis TaxID=398037 RepID=UPI00039D3213|nr:conjugative transposon protein TraN [Segetibacter koreensis]